jgi:DNA primase
MPLSSPPHARIVPDVAGVDVPRERAFEVNALAWAWFTRPVAREYALSYPRHHRHIDLRKAELEAGLSFAGHTGHGWTTLIDHLHGHSVTNEELLALALAQPSRRGTLIDTLRDGLGSPGSSAATPAASPRRRRTATLPHAGVRQEHLPLPADQTSSAGSGGHSRRGTTRPLVVTATAASAGMAKQVASRSTLGTTVSSGKARRVLAISTEASVIALDGDPAGREGALHWVDAICRAARRPALVTRLLDGLDPAE